MDPYNIIKIWASKKLEANKHVPNRTIVFDLDDTLINTNICINNTYFPHIKRMVELAWYAKRLGYYIIIITARPKFDKKRVLENLELIGVEADAVFLCPFDIYYTQYTKEEIIKILQFKPFFRANLEKLDIDIISEMTSDELYYLDPYSIESPDHINIVMTIGDQPHDISECKMYGILLPSKNRDGIFNIAKYYKNNKLVL